MKYLTILIAITVSFTLSFAGYAEGKDDSERPNIIVFLADDMGFSDIGSYGAEIIETPHIDGLAREGQRFTQFYNAARCSPTRASLLTGKYPHQSGMGWLAGPDVQAPGYIGHLNDNTTIAEAMGSKGYKTMMVGKWHVGNKGNGVLPWTRGFDRYFGRLTRADYWDPEGLILDGEPYDWQGDNFFMTDAIGEYGAGFVDDHLQNETEQPFFMYMAFFAPHFPLHAQKDDIEKYRGRFMKGWDKLRQDRYKNLIERNIISGEQAVPPREPAVPAWDSLSKEKQRAWDLNMSVYAAQITAMDRAIGQVLDELERHGEKDKTLILFLSDNGANAEGIGINESHIRNDNGIKPGGPDSFQAYLMPWADVSSTPFRFYKHWAHEGGIATPLIARWPEVISEKGSIVDSPGHVMDIMATAIDVAEMDSPGPRAKESISIEGQSLLPLFQGKDWEGKRRLFWEHEGHRAMRDGKWKLVSAHEFDSWFYEKWGFPRDISAEWELYNMDKDRFEQNNLAESHPERLDEMKKAYKEWADKVGVEDWNKIRPQLPLFDE